MEFKIFVKISIVVIIRFRQSLLIKRECFMKIYVLNDYSEGDSISLIKRFFCCSEFQLTNSIINADFIFVPTDIGKFYADKIIKLYTNLLKSKHYQKYSYKYIFYSSLDNSWNFPLSGIWLRESVRNNINSKQSICIPYPTMRQTYVRPKINTYTINFVGSLITHPIRNKIIQYYYGLNKINKIIMIPRFEYQGHVAGDHKEIKKRTDEMIQMIRNTFITISPRGAGMNSMRFFETLSFGRIPLLISDDCVLPFENRIDYKNIIYRINENEIKKINDMTLLTTEEMLKKCERVYDVFNENFVGASLSKNLHIELLDKREKIRKDDLILKHNLTEYFYSHIDEYYKRNELYNIFSTIEFVNSITNHNKELQETLSNMMINIKEVLTKDIQKFKDQYISYLESRILSV